jgi:hypothetical protein
MFMFLMTLFLLTNSRKIAAVPKNPVRITTVPKQQPITCSEGRTRCGNECCYPYEQCVTSQTPTLCNESRTQCTFPQSCS